jgi:hypothetical protein
MRKEIPTDTAKAESKGAAQGERPSLDDGIEFTASGQCLGMPLKASGRVVRSSRYRIHDRLN